MPQHIRLFCLTLAILAGIFCASPSMAQDDLIVPQADTGAPMKNGAAPVDATDPAAKPAAVKEDVAWGKLSKEMLGPTCDTTIKSGKKPFAVLITIPASFCKSAKYADSNICVNKVTEARVDWKNNNRKIAAIAAEGKLVFLNGTLKDVKDCWYPSATFEVSSIRPGQ
ncbi:MAG: hypothetical protein PW788_03050 [Micavibrio sp.]|nr:hypothetical protein [Micavibrio sp.]